MSNPFILPLLFAALMASTSMLRAEGELMVMPATLKVYAGHEHSVRVSNRGDAPLYLSVSLQKVTNPGFTPEVKVPINDVENPSLLASPDRITLGPGQSRPISLRSLNEPQSEQLYRLYILPARTMQVQEAPKDKISAPMSVAVGYGVLIRHMPPPAKQRASWTHHCEPGGIRLENTGTIRMLIDKFGAGVAKEHFALFPGTPRIVPEKNITLVIDEKKQDVACPN
ncbi:hypothetical protein MKZ87_21680 [Pseudomonas sp. MCal1]|uniref:hypothetical protein n=1 Tax=Pseudomonas sp. MCal1 TaxID=2919887 RepID=UPI0022526DE3|nr:hypothetical protein [Pseudomonas sp. MCal1]MCX4220259.1 hypothetical protein [Pseudomonas sp. MCal1]